MREQIPARLADLIATKPDRLLRQLEHSYAALRQDAEGPGRQDLARRLTLRTAAADNAQRDLTDWMKTRAGDDEIHQAQLRKVTENVKHDMDRLRNVLLVAALVPGAQVKAKVLQVLLDVHTSLKQMRDSAKRMIQSDSAGQAEAPVDSEAEALKQRHAAQMRPREGGF
ncbi:hypothetical protein [Achromobacter sp. DH1f]|uniref:hypothetical protein n=1 Tax=Achromobacter sp. DH1f TaxID=1397275 RepID=UPI001E5D6C7E|nr:hypothetical protein [Achromobacter sp. DH1f]